MQNSIMTKRMRIMLICVGILFGCVILYKLFIMIMTKRAIAGMSHVVTPVSTMKAGYSSWQPHITSTGSMRAIMGVNVTTELAGMVQKIYFKPGSYVTEGTLLVQLNANAEKGQLQALLANAELARITYERDKAQYAIKAVSKQTVDSDFQNLKNLQGQVAQQTAIVEKKAIRAPFTGRLGINYVNPGQFIDTGAKIVPLQTLNPIYADFFVPQQQLTDLKVGQTVAIKSDMHPGKTYTGKITTINPAVDTDTRNIEVEATIANPNFELTPGAFIRAEVLTGDAKPHLTLPQTAVSFNPYGSIVYLVEQQGKNKDGKPKYIANQAFVVTGETRGTQVVITQGIKEGDIVVTSGQLKLKNGSEVTIDNSIVPLDSPNPKLPNDH